MSSETPPKVFQQTAIDSAVKVFSSCLTELAKVRGTANEQASRQLIIANRGCLLFEAPTGTGKTLMAGNTIEQLSLNHKMIWFWFAPFGGLIEQTAKTIRLEFHKLQTKTPADDRDIESLSTGDVFITTWASVAVVNKETRKLRKDSETQLSFDEMIEMARSLGFHIGVVIDESHHSFRGDSQAFKFYHEVLAPDLTILSTATPKDVDVDDFVAKNKIKHLNRISISRQSGIDAGLIKEGVKVAVFKAPQPEIEELVNFQKTALKYGVRAHNQIKTLLIEAGQTVTPLLLVQADSQDHVSTVVDWLYELGFSVEQVRSHTAKEPDPHLLAIAADENVEVLVFIMAVATGFDVPRAFTLVSMKTSRDPDFGTQIVGRIMRVDRRLQAVPDLPPALNNAYVFLSDIESQPGLSVAAQRINTIKDEFAVVSDNVSVINIGNEEPFAQEADKHGQFSFIPKNNDQDTSPAGKETGTHAVLDQFGQRALFDLGLTLPPAQPLGGSGGTAVPPTVPPKPSIYRYPLRTDITFPNQFKKAIISADQANLLAEVVSLFRFDDTVINVAMQSAAKIFMEQVEIFGQNYDIPEEIQAILAQNEIDRHAQLSLNFANKDGIINIRDLFLALEKQLDKEFKDRGWSHVDSPAALEIAMNKILALRPAMLRDAVIEATKRHIDIVDAEMLPPEVISGVPLQPSRFNIYKVYPADLNTWELPFVKELDRDITGRILWWHRNTPKKPYSVGIPLPGQPKQSYYWPDLIVGIHGRSRGNGILLVETKRILNDQEGNAHAKSKVEHPEYKKPMMLYWEKEERWMTVEYDPVHDKNELDRVWKAELMVGW